MIPGTKEIALIQHRRGTAVDLPSNLEEAELGFCTDTGDLVIGAPNLHELDGRERDQNNIFPYHNLRILTELTDVTKETNYSYSGSGEAITYPTIVLGYDKAVAITSTDKFMINGIELLPTPSMVLDAVVDMINGANISNVTAANVEGVLKLIGYNNQTITVQNSLRFYAWINGTSILMTEKLAPSVGDQVYLKDGSPAAGITVEEYDDLHETITINGTVYAKSLENNLYGEGLQKLKILAVGTNSATYTTSATYNRTLEKRLDDEISIKTFGVEGDGNQDDSGIINDAFTSIYLGTEAPAKRKLNFPAGIYSLVNQSVYLSSYTYINGEGTDATIIQSDKSPVLGTMDSNGAYSTSGQFGANSATNPDNILVRNTTFKNTNFLDVVQLADASNITFENCRFEVDEKEDGTAKLVNIVNRGNFTADKCKNITFKNSYFKNGQYGLYINVAANNIVVDNCVFDSVLENSIYISKANNITISNCIFENTQSNAIINVLEDANNISISGCQFLNIKDQFCRLRNSSGTLMDDLEYIVDIPRNVSGSIVLYKFYDDNRCITMDYTFMYTSIDYVKTASSNKIAVSGTHTSGRLGYMVGATYTNKTIDRDIINDSDMFTISTKRSAVEDVNQIQIIYNNDSDARIKFKIKSTKIDLL